MSLTVLVDSSDVSSIMCYFNDSGPSCPKTYSSKVKRVISCPAVITQTPLY